MPSHSLPTRRNSSKHRNSKRGGPNIHPDAARTLHDLIFTRLKHSHSFHKDDEEVKQIRQAKGSGEDIRVVLIDEKLGPVKSNIYTDGERMLSTYYNNLSQNDARLTEKELFIIKKIKTTTRGGTTTNNLFETADRMFLFKDRL